MKRLPSLICLLFGLACAAPARPAGPAPSVARCEASSGLWLTVRFDTGSPFSLPHDKRIHTATVSDAEIGTLVTPGTRFQQQFTCPKGRYGIAGVLGAVSDGQYPLSIRLTGGPSELSETQVRLRLDRPDTWGVIDGYDRGEYTITLSHAPEWQQPNGPMHLTPTAVTGTRP